MPVSVRPMQADEARRFLDIHDVSVLPSSVKSNGSPVNTGWTISNLNPQSRQNPTSFTLGTEDYVAESADLTPCSAMGLKATKESLVSIIRGIA